MNEDIEYLVFERLKQLPVEGWSRQFVSAGIYSLTQGDFVLLFARQCNGEYSAAFPEFKGIAFFPPGIRSYMDGVAHSYSKYHWESVAENQREALRDALNEPPSGTVIEAHAPPTRPWWKRWFGA